MKENTAFLQFGIFPIDISKMRPDMPPRALSYPS